MNKYLTIERARQGYFIHDDISGRRIYYIGYTLKQAIKKHRENMNIKYKHLTKIFLQYGGI